MSQINIEFSQKLIKFIKRKGHINTVYFNLNRKSPIKDIIESYGVPHTEVGNILVNNRSVGFRYFPKNNDAIKVYEIRPPLEVTRPSKLRPETFDEIKFIADVNIGKAAILLRALGFDTFYEDEISDAFIAKLALEEDRIVLTRDIDLLKRKSIIYGQFVDAKEPFEQIRLILERFALLGPFNLFSRCTRCNTLLKSIEKEEIVNRLLPKTKKYYHEFFICSGCDKIYWKGSHMKKIIYDFKQIGVDIG